MAVIMRNVMLAFFFARAAEAAAMLPAGEAGCPCIAELPAGICDIDCSYTWAYNGKCVNATGLHEKGRNFTLYPGNYGETCGVYDEPGSASCFDMTQSPPVELPASKQADWCGRNWCYVNPCACELNDPTISAYFTSSSGSNDLYYSYATCGDLDTYTAGSDTGNTVGNAECKTAASVANCPTAAADGGSTGGTGSTGTTAAPAAPADTSAAESLKPFACVLGLLLIGVRA